MSAASGLRQRRQRGDGLALVGAGQALARAVQHHQHAPGLRAARCATAAGPGAPSAPGPPSSSSPPWSKPAMPMPERSPRPSHCASVGVSMSSPCHCANARPMASASCVPEPKPACAGSTCSRLQRAAAHGGRCARAAAAGGRRHARPRPLARPAFGAHLHRVGRAPSSTSVSKPSITRPRLPKRRPSDAGGVEKAQVQATRRAQLTAARAVGAQARSASGGHRVGRRASIGRSIRPSGSKARSAAARPARARGCRAGRWRCPGRGHCVNAPARPAVTRPFSRTSGT